MKSTTVTTLAAVVQCPELVVQPNCSEGSKFSLLRLQKRATPKVVKNIHCENSSRFELIKCLGWQSHETGRLLCDMIVMASDVNERYTRNTDSLNVYIPKPNIECYRKSFKCAGGKIWNDLPNNIQNTPSVEAFKYAYKKLNFKHRNTY